MSTKNYNLDFQNKNIKLQEILEKINNLPSAGEGETDISDATATAANILQGQTAYIATGKTTGTMPNNGSVAQTFDGINVKSVTVPAGYTSGGSISLDSTIDNEVETQADLITQIKNAINELPNAGESGGEDIDPLADYQRVESITSDGSSYIITDFTADNTCGLEVIASFPALEDRIPMGSRVDSGTNRFYVVYPLSSSSVYYGFNSGSSISCSLSINTKYRLQTNFLNSRLVGVYDEAGTRKANASISATLTQQTCPVAIFGYNYAMNQAVSSKRAYTLYSARCSRGHEVEREYIPCYRKSDGEIGLYEKVTGTFLTNSGTGAFTKGADIDW